MRLASGDVSSELLSRGFEESRMTFIDFIRIQKEWLFCVGNLLKVVCIQGQSQMVRLRLTVA
jgi:hypothetical protein